jgi:hypothetical protein
MYDETVKRRTGISDEERTGISDEEIDESVETKNGCRAVACPYIWYCFIHPLAPRNLRLGGCERSKVALPTFYGFVTYVAKIFVIRVKSARENGCPVFQLHFQVVIINIKASTSQASPLTTIFL